MIDRLQRWLTAVWSNPLYASILVNLWLVALWYFFGTCLSLFNKLVVGAKEGKGLFGAGRFPAPFLFTSVQLFLQTVFSKAMLNSGCVRRRAASELTWKEYWMQIVPNGVATGLDIGLSNTSLAFVSLSFYTMLKSTTPLFLLLFAILMGIERMSWRLAGVVSVISLGLFLLVEGETEFNLAGFFMVISASALAGLRWAITQVLLQGDAHSASRGGAIEIIEALSPVMGITLLVTSLCVEKPWRLAGTPFFSSWAHSSIVFGVALADALIALCMVYAEFTLIANTSALTFMVAGTFKEVVTIGAAVLFLGEEFTPINGLGLLTLICGVSLYNYFKYQKYKEDLLKQSQVELMSEYDDMVVGYTKEATETTSLLSPLGPERAHTMDFGNGSTVSPRYSRGAVVQD
jgi:solute carrier family 35 protein C2